MENEMREFSDAAPIDRRSTVSRCLKWKREMKSSSSSFSTEEEEKERRQRVDMDERSPPSMEVEEERKRSQIQGRRREDQRGGKFVGGGRGGIGVIAAVGKERDELIKVRGEGGGRKIVKTNITGIETVEKVEKEEEEKVEKEEKEEGQGGGWKISEPNNKREKEYEEKGRREEDEEGGGGESSEDNERRKGEDKERNMMIEGRNIYSLEKRDNIIVRSCKSSDISNSSSVCRLSNENSSSSFHSNCSRRSRSSSSESSSGCSSAVVGSSSSSGIVCRDKHRYIRSSTGGRDSGSNSTLNCLSSSSFSSVDSTPMSSSSSSSSSSVSFLASPQPHLPIWVEEEMEKLRGEVVRYQHLLSNVEFSSQNELWHWQHRVLELEQQVALHEMDKKEFEMEKQKWRDVLTSQKKTHEREVADLELQLRNARNECFELIELREQMRLIRQHQQQQQKEEEEEEALYGGGVREKGKNEGVEEKEEEGETKIVDGYPARRRGMGSVKQHSKEEFAASQAVKNKEKFSNTSIQFLEKREDEEEKKIRGRELVHGRRRGGGERGDAGRMMTMDHPHRSATIRKGLIQNEVEEAVMSKQQERKCLRGEEDEGVVMNAEKIQIHKLFKEVENFKEIIKEKEEMSDILHMNNRMEIQTKPLQNNIHTFMSSSSSSSSKKITGSGKCLFSSHPDAAEMRGFDASDEQQRFCESEEVERIETTGGGGRKEKEEEEMRRTRMILNVNELERRKGEGRGRITYNGNNEKEEEKETYKDDGIGRSRNVEFVNEGEGEFVGRYEENVKSSKENHFLHHGENLDEVEKEEKTIMMDKNQINSTFQQHPFLNGKPPKSQNVFSHSSLNVYSNPSSSPPPPFRNSTSSIYNEVNNNNSMGCDIHTSTVKTNHNYSQPRGIVDRHNPHSDDDYSRSSSGSNNNSGPMVFPHPHPPPPPLHPHPPFVLATSWSSSSSYSPSTCNVSLATYSSPITITTAASSLPATPTTTSLPSPIPSFLTTAATLNTSSASAISKMPLPPPPSSHFTHNTNIPLMLSHTQENNSSRNETFSFPYVSSSFSSYPTSSSASSSLSSSASSFSHPSSFSSSQSLCAFSSPPISSSPILPNCTMPSSPHLSHPPYLDPSSILYCSSMYHPSHLPPQQPTGIENVMRPTADDCGGNFSSPSSSSIPQTMMAAVSHLYYGQMNVNDYFSHLPQPNYQQQTPHYQQPHDHQHQQNQQQHQHELLQHPQHHPQHEIPPSSNASTFCYEKHFFQPTIPSDLRHHHMCLNSSSSIPNALVGMPQECVVSTTTTPPLVSAAAAAAAATPVDFPFPTSLSSSSSTFPPSNTRDATAAAGVQMNHPRVTSDEDFQTSSSSSYHQYEYH